MAKPSKRTLRVQCNFRAVLSLGLQDLEFAIGSETYEALASLVDDPVAFLSFLEAELSQAVARDNFIRVAALRQLHALLKKNADLPGTNQDLRKEAAMSKFFDAERRCRITNKRLSHYKVHFSRMPNMVSKVVFMARDYVQQIMGPLGHAEMLKIISHSDFGPGLTFSSNGQESKNLYFKLLGDHSVTAEALPYARMLLLQRLPWLKALLENDCTYDIVRGNRVTTVPKDAVTDRTIAIEPSFNVMLQKGVDGYLKRRLTHFGVDLTNQEANHHPARQGSMEPLHAATLDLESASDSVSIEVVRWLVPHEWFILLDDLRSKEFTLDRGKTWQRYSKFSSMGNANTFPLESILFYSLSKACSVLSGCELSTLRVYGDDIVINPRAALLLIEVLKFLGFKVNPSKSFTFGPFRETCGSDFLWGVDLRPVYLRRLPRSDVEVFNFFNRLVHNRVGFRFHRLCEYLFGLPLRPLIGPSDLPPGRKYWKWYAGKSIEFDRYFHAPPESGERFKRFDPELQRYIWKLGIIRFIPKKLDSSNLNLQFWYLVFLYGGRSGSGVESVSRFRRVIQSRIFLRWEAMPWRPSFYDSAMS